MCSVMILAVFCWETLGLDIQVDAILICKTYLKVVADHVRPFMAVVFPDGRGLFKQDNTPFHAHYTNVQ